MPSPSRRLFAAAVGLGLLLGTASANADAVPNPVTGSEQSVSVPHAEPGNYPARHTAFGELAQPQASHLSAPPLLGPDTGSAASPRIAETGEAGPHSDVTSPGGFTPQSNEGAPR